MARNGIRDFGAIGDGKADDSAAIQRAVDAGVGGVHFTRGTYRLAKGITIDLDKVGYTAITGDGTASILMAGAGPAFYFVGTHGGTAVPASVKPEVWSRQRTPVVDHLEIVGGHPQADGIQAEGTMQLTITETVVRDARHGIRLTGRNRNVVISACHLYNNRGIGVFYDGVNLHQSNIVGSHISYNAGGGVVIRGGEVRNVQIGTCDIESNMLPDGPPTANVLIDCTGGSTDEVAIVGCTLQHNSKSPGSANVRVIGTGITSAKNPTVTQEGHIAIVGNAMSDVRVNVHLDHARGVSIVGNTFWEGFDHDLLVEDSQCIVIGPNDFDRNPRYVVNGNWAKDVNGLTFRNCADCKLSGLIVKGVWMKAAAVLMAACDRFTLTDVSILDCDNIGLWMKDCTRSKVSDCVIRDDRQEKKATLSLKVEGGKDNWITGNVLGNGLDAPAGVGVIGGSQK